MAKEAKEHRKVPSSQDPSISAAVEDRPVHGDAETHTKDLLLEEVLRLVEAARAGRLDERGRVETLKGSDRRVVEGVNAILDAILSPVGEANRVLAKIGAGQIDELIGQTYSGQHEKTKQAVNSVAVTLQGLQKELGRLTEAARAGQLSERGNPGQFQGAYAGIVRSVDEILDATLRPIDEFHRILRLIRSGNLREEVEIACKGDHDKMKQTINGLHGWLSDLIGYVTKIANGDLTASIVKASDQDQTHQWLVLLRNNLGALAANADMLAQAGVAGNLETRADAARHQGDFRKIVEGFNRTLDSVAGVFGMVDDYLEKIGQGAIPDKIAAQYNGDFNTIKTNLNNCIDGLGSLTETSSVLQRMAFNDYSRRVDGNAAGIFGDIAQAVNTVHKRITHLESTLHRISKGDLSELPEYKAIGRRSEHDILVPALILLMENLKALVEDATMLAAAAVEGNLSKRADAGKHEGDYRRVIEGVNATLSAVVDPIQEAAAVIAKIAEQDLTARVTGQYRGDHAVIKEDINRMAADLRNSIQQIAENASLLASSAEELTASSQQMAGNAEETATQANVVSAASEQVSTNVSIVASSSEEMQASIREIATSANEAAKIANNAVKAADSTNQTIGRLGESSVEIGKVIKVITSIAQQTNLLALNATIEAARAGEAGKGFAVVANEVKELAKETAKATEEIGQKIEAIQIETRSAVQAIGEIGAVINQINDISTAIASAVEEQTVTTNEIGRNVAEAARGTSDIAKNISGVAQAAQNTTHGAADSQKAASSLAAMASHLQSIVGKFKL